MAVKKKRRIRSPHPGVVLLDRTLPSGRRAVQARYTDPDTGKLHKPLLDLVALPTHEARVLWAKRLSQTLAKRRMDIEAGTPKRIEKSFADAISEYVKSGERRLRARTLVVYMQGIKRFDAWARKEGVTSTADVTPARLATFREQLVAAPRAGVKRGGRRGERRETTAKRSPFTINCELRAVKTMLNAWRVAGLVPTLTRDAITDAMKALPVPREQAEYLTPSQLQRLFDAAERHDGAVFAETRQEHAGLAERGSTRRYEPIALFAAFLALTGCRRGEALGLTWSDVDLEAVDPQGRVVGEIRLRAANTKTHQARTIGLEVSPALRALLATMKLRAGSDSNMHHVFGGERAFTADLVESSRARLIEEFRAPKFDWQMLRSTCATYLTNAPGIFGAATVFLSARQLGHSVAVAERHYLGVHRGISKDAHTLEAAMHIGPHVARLADVVTRMRPLSTATA
jgi:integrase